MSAAGTVATTLISAACSIPPYLFIPLAASVALLILGAVNLFYVIREHRHGRSMAVQAAVLESHFDSSNPAQPFRSSELPRDKDSDLLPGIFHEYQMAIFNPAAHTVCNVVVPVESLGLSSLRPYDAWFDKEPSLRRNIFPGYFESVPVRIGPHARRQPGMLAKPSCLVGYGSSLITASADDVAPAIRKLWFSPEQEPMLFDSLAPGEGERAKASLTRL